MVIGNNRIDRSRCKKKEERSASSVLMCKNNFGFIFYASAYLATQSFSIT